MVKRAFLALLLTISAPIIVFGASSIGVNSFSGLDTQDNPSALQPNQSQDLLNVRIQPGGRSVFKRDGYGLFQTLNAFSHGIHGGYHFQQAGGSDVQLWASSSTLYGIVNDAPAVALATGTIDATWQCTDNLGFAYCVTSSGDMPVKTDGTVANTTYQPGIPAGTIIMSTPLQLVVAGVAGNVSTIYVSANNNFTNFTVGPLPTDPYTEIINAPGSRITTLGYYFGNIYWWKDQSMGYLSGSASQGTIGITTVSNQIGTLDNSSAFWNPTTYDAGNKFNTGAQTTAAGNPYFNEMSTLGGVFFRGQDNHIYQYDGYTLTRLSRIITPNVTASGRHKTNSWNQTTQSDFQTGSIVPTANLSTVISPGDVIVSSFGATENSSTQWNSGTASSNLTINPSSITLNINNSGNITNPDFESAFAGNWTNSGTNNYSQVTSDIVQCGTINPQTGSNFAKSSGSESQSALTSFRVIDLNSTVLAVSTMTLSLDCTWRQFSLSPGANIGKRVKFQLFDASNPAPSGVGILTTSDSYIWGGAITGYFSSGRTGSGANFIDHFLYDNIQNGSSTIASGSFTSQIYDTGFASATYSLSNFAWTANTSSPTFALQTSSSNPTNNWVNTATSSGTNAIGNRYVRYVSTISVGATDNALTSISAATILARSTGTYYSSVNNAPNITTFGTFTTDDSVPGVSSITYYTRSSTNSFTVLSATPSWTQQTKNATVAASTGTFMQMRADFYLTAATEAPTINDFQFNWFEGTAGDKAYLQYFQDAVWFGVSSGSTTSKNNTIFYLDLLNSTWLKDNIAANGFAVENNALYIGDPSAPKVYKFGGVTTDNGAAIQSYWKSKDFTGDDPTVKNDWNQTDFAFAESSNTATYTYSVDQGTSTTFATSIPLYSPTSSIIKRGFALDRSAVGTYYNFTIGDNSSLSAWTLMGLRTTYVPLPWRPQVSN